MSQKYTCNYNYFSRPTIENSYWAGFIAADGCIYKQKNHSDVLCIGLAPKDKSHVEQFKQDIKFSGKIYDIIQKPCNSSFLKNEYYSSRIRISSKNICNDLFKNWNITSKKSLTYQPPLTLNEKEILSFIIGYIDGDGCIQQNTQTRLIIAGTKELLEWINSQFNNYGKISPEKRTKNNTWYLHFGGENCRNILKQCKEHIKEYNLKVLDRKWSKII